MAETEVEILNIDTSKSVRSINNLKSEIKELRERLYGLEQGTEEYNEVLSELGEKQRLVAETTYRISEASTDFSNNITNVTGAIGGMSGAVQAVTGTLSLLGVEMGDDTKLMKTLVAAMSITSGVTAIQSGYTALRRLTEGLRMATAGTKTLGSAMKSLALANPFMTAVAAIAAVIAIIAKMKSKAKEAAEEMAERQKEAAEKTKERWEKAVQSVSALFQRLSNPGVDWIDFWNYDEFQQQLQTIEGDYGQMYLDLEKKITAFRKLQYEKSNADPEWKYTEEGKKAYKEYYAALRQMALIHYKDAESAVGEAGQNLRKELQKQYTEALMAEQQFDNDAEKKRSERRKAAAQSAVSQLKSDLANIAKIQRAAQIALMSDEDAELAKLKDTYDEQVKLYEKRGQDITTITQLYEKQRQEIIDKYTNERVAKQIEAAEKEEERAENLSAALLALTEKQIADEQAIYDELGIDVNNRLAASYTPEKVEEAEMLMEEAYMALLEKKIELDQQLLQSDQLTEEDRAAVQADLLALQQEQADKSVEIERKALEKRKTLNQNYAKALQSITNSVSSILGSIGETLEQGSNQWKMVKIAEATISTIQGGIAAYMGMVESIPGPAGLIAGAAAAVATVAAGMVEISKIRNTEISTDSSGSTTASTTALGNVRPQAVNVAATQVTNTRQTSTTSDIENLPDQRVYVLESDITNAQNNVKATVEQATF